MRLTERIVNAAIWAMVGLIAGVVLVVVIRSCEPTEVPGRGAALPPAQYAPAGLEIETTSRCGVEGNAGGIQTGPRPSSPSPNPRLDTAGSRFDSGQRLHSFYRATIHHTATPPDRPAERVRNIDAYHRSLGWDGIGYHFLIAEDGQVFPGRPLDRQGAHVKGENGGNLGIAFIGTYADRPPPEAALAAARRLLAWAFETWGFGPEAVYFHKDLAATECPGAWGKDMLWVAGESKGGEE